MPTVKAAASNAHLRNLPSVDEVLRSTTGRKIVVAAGESYTVDLIREILSRIRREIGLRADTRISKSQLIGLVEEELSAAWAAEQLTGIQRVINATGVVIHTNLGRAPLSEEARRAVANHAAGYCTLEYDV